MFGFSYKIRKILPLEKLNIPHKLKWKIPDIYEGTDYSEEYWAKRRKELYSLFEDNVFGKFPEGSKDGFTYAVEEEKTEERYKYIKVRARKEDFSAPFYIFLPAGVKNPPIIVHPILESYKRGLDLSDVWHYKTGFQESTFPTGYVIEQGLGVVYYHTADVASDCVGSECTGILKTLIKEHNGTSAKAIGGWALFARVVADYLFAVGIATEGRLAIAGHSRGGKTALWAGASDERFTFVYSNNAGCTGDSIARHTYGETIDVINGRFPYWFCDNYRKYNKKEGSLPVDFHELIALIAPRYVYVGSSDKDAWACPRNEYLALQEASIVWEKTYNLKGFTADNPPKIGTPYHEGTLAHHIKSGKHSFAFSDWQNLIAFIKKKTATKDNQKQSE